MSDLFVAVGNGQKKRLRDMGDGSHAEVIALANEPAGQTVTGLTLTAPGTGFLTPPNVNFLPPGATAHVTGLKLVSATVGSPGTGHVPGDVLPLADDGGTTKTTQAKAAIATTQVVSAAVAAGHAGTGGTPGPAVVTGTTGTGTKFQANVTIGVGGTVTSVNSIAVAGSYTVNPSAIANEPVTGGGLTGLQLNIVMGAATLTVNTAGLYAAVPANPAAQGTSTGSGVGATINALWGVSGLTLDTGGYYGLDQTVTAVFDGVGTGGTITVAVGTVEQRGGTPVDWCNGTGNLPGTTTTVAANAKRKWLKIQNVDISALSASVVSNKASDGTATTTSFPLAVASAAGKGDGGALEFRQETYLPLGQVVVTGTSGNKAIILEG